MPECSQPPPRQVPSDDSGYLEALARAIFQAGFSSDGHGHLEYTLPSRDPFRCIDPDGPQCRMQMLPRRSAWGNRGRHLSRSRECRTLPRETRMNPLFGSVDLVPHFEQVLRLCRVQPSETVLVFTDSQFPHWAYPPAALAAARALGATAAL